MNTYYAHHELAKHHHADLLRDADAHRLAKEAQVESERVHVTHLEHATRLLQTVLRRHKAPRPAIRSI